MNVVIVYAHPDPKSFNHAVLETVKQGLEAENAIVSVIDLYSEQFNPILVFNENVRRSDLLHNPEVRRYRELMKQADHIIFVYPVWWYSTPAIMKGFIERVFVSGFAYTNQGGLPRGLLGKKSAWVVYTIDSPTWFVKFFRNSIEWKIMKDAFLNYCGIRRVRRFMFAGVKGSSQVQRQKWLDYIFLQSKRLMAPAAVH